MRLRGGRTGIGFPVMPAREAHDWNNASRLGTAKPAVSCDLANEDRQREYDA
jgi:hypothetical protein